jgi:nicotinamidase-related amidase
MNDEQKFELDDLICGMFDPEKAGLLVVDVQERLWPAIGDKDDLLKRIIQAIEVTGQLGLPILVSEQYVKGLGPTIAPVQEALNKFNAYNPIEKFSFSCFGEPTFEEAFDKSGIETLAIVGIETHVCVMQTALDALDRDAEVFFIAEATGSRNKKHKKEALHRVRDAGALIGSVEMFGFEAMRTAKHPAFKKVQKVIL